MKFSKQPVLVRNCDLGMFLRDDEIFPTFILLRYRFIKAKLDDFDSRFNVFLYDISIFIFWVLKKFKLILKIKTILNK